MTKRSAIWEFKTFYLLIEVNKFYLCILLRKKSTGFPEYDRSTILFVFQLEIQAKKIWHGRHRQDVCRYINGVSDIRQYFTSKLILDFAKSKLTAHPLSSCSGQNCHDIKLVLPILNWVLSFILVPSSLIFYSEFCIYGFHVDISLEMLHATFMLCFFNFRLFQAKFM